MSSIILSFHSYNKDYTYALNHFSYSKRCIHIWKKKVCVWLV